MDEMDGKQRDNNIFLELRAYTMSFISRGRF